MSEGRIKVSRLRKIKRDRVFRLSRIGEGRRKMRRLKLIPLNRKISEGRTQISRLRETRDKKKK